jgi:hypothetical protein
MERPIPGSVAIDEDIGDCQFRGDVGGTESDMVPESGIIGRGIIDGAGGADARDISRERWSGAKKPNSWNGLACSGA